MIARLPGWLLPVLIVLVLVIAFILLPVMDWADEFNRSVEHLEEYGWWGVLAFTGIFVICTVLLMPGPLLSLAGGVVFGFAKGFVCVSFGSVLGAGAAFLIARYLARDRFRKLVEKRPKFIAMDRAVRDKGWKIVVLTRLSPVIPSNFQNYLYGITSIRFREFLGATYFGKLPAILMYLYLGAGGRAGLEAAEDGADPNPWKPYLLAVGFLATAAMAWYGSRISKEVMREYAR